MKRSWTGHESVASWWLNALFSNTELNWDESGIAATQQAELSHFQLWTSYTVYHTSHTHIQRRRRWEREPKEIVKGKTKEIVKGKTKEIEKGKMSSRWIRSRGDWQGGPANESSLLGCNLTSSPMWEVQQPHVRGIGLRKTSSRTRWLRSGKVHVQ